MPIIQIVGYQNSGKTTFVQALVQALKAKQFQVGVIKHHGHAETLDFHQDKDTGKLFHVGADVVIANSDQNSEILMRQDFGLKRSIALMQRQNMDVLIIEGYKNEAYKKIVLLSKEEDLVLLDQLDNIQGVYCTHGFSLPERYKYKNLDMQGWESWLVEGLKENKKIF